MDACIDKFLINYKEDNVEKHSDSSDFDEVQTIPFIFPRKGQHSLLDKPPETHAEAKKEISVTSCKNPVNNKVCTHKLHEENMIPVRDNQERKKIRKRDDNKSKIKVNNLNSPQLTNCSKETEYKPKPCFSNIFQRSNNNAKQVNNAKQISSIKEIQEDNLNSGKTFCADCERRRMKKLNRRRRSYVVQPVYVDNIQGGPVPFGHANDRAPLSQYNHKVMRKHDSNTSYELTSSDSEIGKTDQRTHLSRRRNLIDKFRKELRKEYVKYEKEMAKSRIQQYPSKKDYNITNQAYSTPYCQTIMNTRSNQSAGPNSNVPTTLSGFWDFIYGKLCRKDDRPCLCHPPSLSPQEQSANAPDNFRQFLPQSNEMPNSQDQQCMPECKSCIQQTENTIGESFPKLPVVKKTDSNKKNAQCECYERKKRSTKNSPMSMTLVDSQGNKTQGNDVMRPCQEPHDDITRTVEEKYNGEILCIHNPPCILINGCLNFPNAQDKPPIQGTYWPVMQDKKKSFYQISRKTKRPKVKLCEQACQYHPPSIDVRALQIKSEKIVQSICNHDPPCEVVYGCYKAKYDPNLDNSCVHVPMCQRLPECWVAERNREIGSDKLCAHKPKCNQVPLCSRKLVVLTARGTVGTQVRPKSMLVCRHEPPCIMIPKCLARIISDSYIPYDGIPDCVHQPRCELIPACCRRTAKDMVSVSSQYPNAPCRIV